MRFGFQGVRNWRFGWPFRMLPLFRAVLGVLSVSQAALHSCSRPTSRPSALQNLPAVSIAVPFFGLTTSILRILKGNLKTGTTMETIGNFLNTNRPHKAVVNLSRRLKS